MYKTGLGIVMVMASCGMYSMEEFKTKPATNVQVWRSCQQYKEIQDFHNACVQKTRPYLKERSDDSSDKIILTGTSARLLTFASFLTSGLLSCCIITCMGVDDPYVSTGITSAVTLASTALTHRFFYTQRTPEGQLQEIKQYVALLEKDLNTNVSAYSTCKRKSPFNRTLEDGALKTQEKTLEDSIRNSLGYLKKIEKKAALYPKNRHIVSLLQDCERIRQKANDKLLLSRYSKVD